MFNEKKEIEKVLNDTRRQTEQEEKETNDVVQIYQETKHRIDCMKKQRAEEVSIKDKTTIKLLNNKFALFTLCLTTLKEDNHINLGEHRKSSFLVFLKHYFLYNKTNNQTKIKFHEHCAGSTLSILM